MKKSHYFIGMAMLSLAFAPSSWAMSGKSGCHTDEKIEVVEQAPHHNFVRIINDSHAFVHTQIDIHAPIQKVWDVLTNFDDMAWSPYFRGIDGKKADGEKVKIKVLINDEVIQFPMALTWVEGKRLGWKGEGTRGPHLHDNHMFYLIKKSDAVTTLYHTDQVTSTSLEKIKLSHKDTVANFKSLVGGKFMAFNAALKKKVEQLDHIPEQSELVMDVSSKARHAKWLTIYGPHRASVHSEVVINAPVAKVWQVATDFDKMSEWSSTYQNIIGNKENGNMVDLVVKGPDGKDRSFPQLLRWEEGQRFGWSGGKDLYDNHMFLFIPLSEDKTIFIQADDGTTTAVGEQVFTNEKMVKMNKGIFARNYNAFNQELKHRVENTK